LKGSYDLVFCRRDYFLVALLWDSNAKLSKLNNAKKSCIDSLKDLKKDPANSDLRQKTLALGRAYSNLARDSKGQTIFDEVALLNDLNAACTTTGT
jgi:hypothetical protein